MPGKWKRPDNTPTESNTTGTAEAISISKWNLRASKVRGILGQLLDDTAHREIYAKVNDPKKELLEKLEKRYAGKDHQARIG